MSLNKKVTKEVSIGEALRPVLPHEEAALPYEPHPARIAISAEDLNDRRQKTYGLAVGGGP